MELDTPQTSVHTGDKDTKVAKADEDDTKVTKAVDATKVIESEDDTKVKKAEDDTTVTKAEDDSKVKIDEDDTKDTKAEDDTKVKIAEDDSKVPEAEDDSKVKIAEDDTKVTKAEGDIKVKIAEDDTKVKEDEDDIKVPTAEDDAKIKIAEDDTKVKKAKDDATVTKAEDDTRVTETEDDVKVTKPEEDDLDQEKGIYLSDKPFVDKASKVTQQPQSTGLPCPEKSAVEKSLPLPPTPKFVFVLTFFATLGGFLMGYDIGIVSGSMLYVRPYFRLSTIWTEAIVSGAVATAAISALCGGWVTDRLGRRPTLLIGSVIFSTGGVVMGAAPDKEILLIGRVICGLGIGLASVVVPIYVAEASPVHMRGRLTLMWQMMINLGVFLSSLIAVGFSYLPHDGWRYMLGLSALPGVIQFIGFLFMPESPRWLVDKGHVQQAERVLVRTRGYSDVKEELHEIERSVNEAKAMEMRGCHLLVQIVKTPHVRRALIVGVMLLVIQQWCGINTAIYYSGTVMKMAGFPVKAAVWLVVAPTALLFFAGLLGIYVVDRIGRRPLLIWSMVGTIVGSAIIAVGFQLAETHPPTLDPAIVETYDNGTVLTRCHLQYSSCDACIKDIDCGFCNENGETSGSCLPAANEERSLYGRCNTSESDDSKFRFAHGYCPSDKYSWMTAVGVALFVFLFSPGMAPMPWTINSEIYPLWARGTCNSIAATACWTSNLIISFTFLSMTEAITTYGTFWMFTGFSLLGLIFFVLRVPETKGKSLEQVEELFMTASQLEDMRAARDTSSLT